MGNNSLFNMMFNIEEYVKSEEFQNQVSASAVPIALFSILIDKGIMTEEEWKNAFEVAKEQVKEGMIQAIKEKLGETNDE